MKISFFNFKEVEEAAFQDWKENNPEIEVVSTEKDLTEETKHLLDNSDAVVISQIKTIPDEIYEYAKEQGVKVFSTRSAGVDMYNREKLNDLGIKLTNVPSYSPNAIAEHAVIAALMIARNINKILKNVSNHNFSWEKRVLSREMRTLTVGIIGTGRIGIQAAKLFNGLGAKVIGINLEEVEEAKKYLTYVNSIDEIAEQSDIVSIHMPATKENHHMINDEFLSKMKDNSILVNSARGAIIDTEAVLRALDSNKLLGVGLDVYEFEGNYVPRDLHDEIIDDKVFLELIERDDVLYTPHTAYFTETAVDNLVQGALNSAKNYVENNDDENIVNF